MDPVIVAVDALVTAGLITRAQAEAGAWVPFLTVAVDAVVSAVRTETDRDRALVDEARRIAEQQVAQSRYDALRLSAEAAAATAALEAATQVESA